MMLCVCMILVRVCVCTCMHACVYSASELLYQLLYSYSINLIGKKNPLATLATLILLSYAKLLLAKSLSVGILEYPSKMTPYIPKYYNIILLPLDSTADDCSYHSQAVYNLVAGVNVSNNPTIAH